MATSTSAESYRAYLAWSRAAGPFWQYVSALPFTSPPAAKPRRGDLAQAGADLVGRHLAPVLQAVPGRALLVLDLPLPLGIAAAPALLEVGCLVAPMVFRWPDTRAELSVAEAKSALLALAPRLRAPEAPVAVALILDGEREGDRVDLAPSRRLDNRYGYPPDVFPPVHALREWGAVAALFAGAGSSLREDVAEYAARLADAGLPTTRLWVPIPASGR